MNPSDPSASGTAAPDSRSATGSEAPASGTPASGVAKTQDVPAAAFVETPGASTSGTYAVPASDPRAGPTPAPSAAPGWRHSKWLALLEFALVAGVFLADRHHLVPLSKTPFFLLIGWISLRLRGLRWRDVGFTMNGFTRNGLTRDQGWGRTLALGVAGGLALELFQLFVTQRLLARLTGTPPDLSDLLRLHGNLKYSLLGLAFSWTFAAFGEELVWRGYLMNRVAGLLNGTPLAWIGSLVFVNIAFGCAHSYQGLTGIIEESLAGIFIGLMYLRSAKNLAVPIVAHGVCDTLDVLLLFLGKYPGT